MPVRNFKYDTLDPTIILIGGPSGAGKSELSRQIAAILRATVVQMDQYFLNREEVPFEEIESGVFDRQWEAPAAFDIGRALIDIETLIRNRKATLPIYDYKENKRVGFHEVHREGNIVIVEGIQAVHLQPFLENIGIAKVMSLYLDADVNMRERVISLRDASERGKPNGQELRRITRLAGEERWIARQKASTDLILLREDFNAAEI